LRDIGCGFDIATNGEIDIIRPLGIDPATCIHTHPIKKDKDIRYAMDYGIETFVFDNANEIEKLLPYKDKINLVL